MTKIPCEVIEDLLPSYVDGLTSAETNRLIEEHLNTCDNCRRMYNDMKDAGKVPEYDPVEIDFLKTTNIKANRKIGMFMAAFMTGVLLVLGIRTYVIGQNEEPEHIRTVVREADGMLEISGTLEDGRALKDVTYTENGSVLDVEVRTVPESVLYKDQTFSEFLPADTIRTVRINERVIWESGVMITSKTAAVMATVHPYIGDMSANNETAYAAEIPLKFGPFTNELQTIQEPYGWTIILEDPLYDRAYQEQQMDRSAAVLIAAVGNLSEVTFRYTADGMTCSRTVTEQDADALAGFRIKDAAENYALMQRLVNY